MSSTSKIERDAIDFGQLRPWAPGVDANSALLRRTR